MAYHYELIELGEGQYCIALYPNILEPCYQLLAGYLEYYDCLNFLLENMKQGDTMSEEYKYRSSDIISYDKFKRHMNEMKKFDLRINQSSNRRKNV